MNYKPVKSLFSAVVSSCLLLTGAVPAFSAAGDTDGWRFHLAPYAWLAGQKGTISTFGNLPTVDIDIDFWDDVLGNINGALFLVGEAQKGKFGIMLDLAYTDIEDGNATPGPLFSSAVTQTKTWMVTTAAEYRVVDRPQAFVDIFAGVRYWSVESELTLKAGVLPRQKGTTEEDWLDPLVGAKARMGLGDSNFFLTGIGQLGGFGAGSDLMWDVSAHLGYNLTETIATTLGFRYLDVDYEDDGFIYDVSQCGPVVGLSWRF